MLFGVINVLVYIESLRVIDLLKKGVYNIKIKCYRENDNTVLATPYILKAGSGTSNNRLGETNHNIKDHEILSTLNTYSSKKFFVQYVNEFILFGNYFIFQIEIPLHNFYSNNIIIDFDLVFYTTEKEDTIEEKIVSQQKLKIGKPGYGVHQYYPITFSDWYFCLLKTTISTCMIDIVFKHHSIDSNPTIGIQPNSNLYSLSSSTSSLSTLSSSGSSITTVLSSSPNNNSSSNSNNSSLNTFKDWIDLNIRQPKSIIICNNSISNKLESIEFILQKLHQLFKFNTMLISSLALHDCMLMFLLDNQLGEQAVKLFDQYVLPVWPVGYSFTIYDENNKFMFKDGDICLFKRLVSLGILEFNKFQPPQIIDLCSNPLFINNKDSFRMIKGWSDTQFLNILCSNPVHVFNVEAFKWFIQQSPLFKKNVKKNKNELYGISFSGDDNPLTLFRNFQWAFFSVELLDHCITYHKELFIKILSTKREVFLRRFDVADRFFNFINTDKQWPKQHSLTIGYITNDINLLLLMYEKNPLHAYSGRITTADKALIDVLLTYDNSSLLGLSELLLPFNIIQIFNKKYGDSPMEFRLAPINNKGLEKAVADMNLFKIQYFIVDQRNRVGREEVLKALANPDIFSLIKEQQDQWPAIRKWLLVHPSVLENFDLFEKIYNDGYLQGDEKFQRIIGHQPSFLTTCILNAYNNLSSARGKDQKEMYIRCIEFLKQQFAGVRYELDFYNRKQSQWEPMFLQDSAYCFSSSFSREDTQLFFYLSLTYNYITNQLSKVKYAIDALYRDPQNPTASFILSNILERIEGIILENFQHTNLKTLFYLVEKFSDQLSPSFVEKLSEMAVSMDCHPLISILLHRTGSLRLFKPTPNESDDQILKRCYSTMKSYFNRFETCSYFELYPFSI